MPKQELSFERQTVHLSTGALRRALAHFGVDYELFAQVYNDLPRETALQKAKREREELQKRIRELEAKEGM